MMLLTPTALDQQGSVRTAEDVVQVVRVAVPAQRVAAESVAVGGLKDESLVTPRILTLHAVVEGDGDGAVVLVADDLLNEDVRLTVHHELITLHEVLSGNAAAVRLVGTASGSNGHSKSPRRMRLDPSSPDGRLVNGNRHGFRNPSKWFPTLEDKFGNAVVTP